MAYKNQIAVLTMAVDGLTGARNVGFIKDTNLLKAENISFERGLISREGGSAKFNATAITGSPSIIGGFDWWPDDVIQRSIIYTGAGALLKDTGAGTYSVSLKTGLNGSAIPVFVEGGKEAAANNRKLFIANGIDPVQVLSGDGIVTTNVALPPADWTGTNQPAALTNHKNRWCGAGNANDPHRWYDSTLLNHEEFTGAGSGTIVVYPGQGGRITGLLSFKGLIIVWKNKGVYVVDSTDPDISKWTVKRLSDAVGMLNPQAFAVVDDDVIYQDANANLQQISATTEFGDVRGRHFSRSSSISDFIRDNFNITRTNRNRLLY